MSDLRTAAQQALEALGKWSSGRDMDAVQLNDLIATLEAALAEPQEPGCRDDGMPTSAEERHLRRLLALRAAMPHAYYDDGEAQGTEHGISIDFMREPVAHIDAKLRALNVARAIAKQAEPVQDHFPEATKMVREPVQETDNKAASIRWQLCLLAQTEEFSDDVRNQIGRGVWLIDRLTEAALEQPTREWRGLKEWEINDGLDQIPSEDVCSWSFRKGVYFAEAALKERNL